MVWFHSDLICPDLLLSSLAVRFGRIPKREKQRLLDEMQSYMNSLNESAALEMESNPERDTPPNSDNCNSKEAIGAISRAYHDIFNSSNNSSSEERPAKRPNISTTTNNNTSPFSQNVNFSQGSSHHNSAPSYQSCPVAPNDNKHTFHDVDNNCYTYLVSTNQNHDQSISTTAQRGSSANHSSFHNAGDTPNQTSCPWKLPPGSKVLVRTQSRHTKIPVLLIVWGKK